MQQPLDYYLLDVFTNQPFGGNPLAIFPNADKLSSKQMHQIAKELNLSETVFLTKPALPEADIAMRIFTPARELPTAGHPTIGAAYLMLSFNLLKPADPNCLRIEQKIGLIKISFDKTGNEINDLLMEQPAPVFDQTFTDKALMASLLNIDMDDIYSNYPCRIVNCGNPFLLIPVKQLASIKQIELNQVLYESILEEVELAGVMPFTLATVNNHCIAHSRMFAPNLGIKEDPATGSAHGPLAAYLHNYQLADLQKVQTCEQGFEMGRPSFIKVQVIADMGKIDKILIGGQSVVMAKGTFYHFE